MLQAWSAWWSDWDTAVVVRATWMRLFVMALIGTLLLCGWWWSTGVRAGWDVLDHDAFVAANGWLRAEDSSRGFWALANTWALDVVAACVILMIYAQFVLADEARYWRPRILLGVLLLVFAGIWMHFGMKLLIDNGRESPSLVMADPVLLNTFFDWPLRIKVTSHDSFPGDHSGVLLLLGVVLWHTASRWRGAQVLLLVVPFSLPRVVGGGHWLTDQIVGGGFAGLVGASVFLALLKLRPVLQRRASAV